MECPLRIVPWNTESPALRLKDKSMFNKSAFLIFRLKAIVFFLAGSLLLPGCNRKPVTAAGPTPAEVVITSAQVFNLSMIGQTWVFTNGYGDRSTIEIQSAPACVAGICGNNVVFHYTKTACRAYWLPGVCGAELWFTLHQETDGSWRSIASKMRFPEGCPLGLCRPHDAPTVVTQNVVAIPGKPLPYGIIPASGSSAQHTIVRTGYKSHWQSGVLTDEPVKPNFPVSKVSWSTATWVETVTTPLTGDAPVNCLVSHQTEDSVEEHWCFAPGVGLVYVAPLRAGKPLDPMLVMKRVR